MKRTLLLSLFLGVAHLLLGQYADESFTPSIIDYPKIEASAIQPDGKLIIAGKISQVNGQPTGSITRLNQDGTLDLTFNPPLDLIGGIYINGISTYGDSLISLSAEGKAWILNMYDGSLYVDLGEIYGTVTAVEKLSDGILIGYIENGNYRIMKLDLNGVPDPSFTSFLTDERVRDAVQLSDQSIIMVGEFTNVNSQSHNYIVKLNADGTIDESFDAGLGADIYIHKIDLDANENIYLTGPFNEFNSVTTKGFIKLLPSGSVDATFQLSTLIQNIDVTLDVEIMGEDDHLLVAAFTSNNLKIIKTALNGSIDGTYPTSIGRSENYTGTHIIDRDTSVIITGIFHNFGSEKVHGIAQIGLDGNALSAYQPLVGSLPIIEDIVIQDDGKIIISGDFYSVNGSSANRIARLNPDGSFDDFGIEFTSDDYIQQIGILQSGKIFIAGTLNSITRGIVWLNPDGTIDESITANNHNVLAFKEVANGNIILGGQFTSIDGGARRSLAMIDATGNLINSFNTSDLFSVIGEHYLVYAIDTLNNGKIAIGGYDSNTAKGFFYILNNDCSNIDYSLTELSQLITVINTDVDNKIFFSGYNWTSPSYIYQRDYEGNISVSDIQSNTFDFYLSSIVPLENSSVLLGGRFTKIGSAEVNHLAMVYYSGIVQSEFDLKVQGGQVNSIKMINDTTAYIVGNFYQTGNLPVSSIAKIYLNDGIPYISELANPININEEESITLNLEHFIYQDKGNRLEDITLSISDGENYMVSDNQIIPDLNFYGTLSIQAQISSPIGTAAPFPFTIEVLPVNDVPIISDQTGVPQINEDNSFAIALNQLIIEDPDNLFPDDFTLEILPGSDYTFEGLTILPNENFFGDLNVNLKVQDLESESEAFIFNIVVLPVNDIPAITGHSVSTEINEDNPLEITLNQLDVVDPDDQFPADFTLEIQSGPNYSITESGIIPNANYFGPLDINIKINDGESLSELFTISIDVLAVNDAPVISDQLAIPEIEEDNPVILAISDLEVLDPDNQFPDDFVMEVLEGQNYSFEGFTITPADNYNGNLTVNLKVIDGALGSEPFPYSIIITPVNDAPIILNQVESPSIIQGLPFEFSTALFNIFDPDNSTGELNINVSVGENYTVSGNTITPDITYTGELNVPVTISDGQLMSDEFLASFEVREPLGLSDISFLNVYPNPVQEVFHINIPTGIQKGEIELINLSGKQVHFQYFQGSEDISIEVSGLIAGFYILKLASGNQVFMRKVLIKPW